MPSPLTLFALRGTRRRRMSRWRSKVLHLYYFCHHCHQLPFLCIQGRVLKFLLYFTNWSFSNVKSDFTTFGLGLNSIIEIEVSLHSIIFSIIIFHQSVVIAYRNWYLMRTYYVQKLVSDTIVTCIALRLIGCISHYTLLWVSSVWIAFYFCVETLLILELSPFLKRQYSGILLKIYKYSFEAKSKDF